MQDSDPRGKELFWLMSRELAGGSVAMLPVFYREVFLRRVQILEPLFITDTIRKSADPNTMQMGGEIATNMRIQASSVLSNTRLAVHFSR
jgi:hypothetical protein